MNRHEVGTWSLLEKAREGWEHAVSDKIIYFGKATGVDDKAINSTAEDYLSGGQWCELHLCLNRDGHSHYACIIELNNRDEGGVHAFRNLEFNSRSLGWDNPMFANIAQFIELPEQVVFVGQPSDIWLKRLDFIDCGTGDVGGVFVEYPHLFRGLFIDNGEGRPVVRNILDREGKLPSDMVKGDPEIVYGVACNYGEFEVNDWNLKPHDVERVLNIFICGEAKGFVLGELIDFGIQNVEVFFRPFDLQPRVLETTRHELNYNHEQREIADSENTKGARDSRAHKGRVLISIRKSSEAGEEIIASPSQPSPRVQLS